MPFAVGVEAVERFHIPYRQQMQEGRVQIPEQLQRRVGAGVSLVFLLKDT
jgi:hypothetical protein